MAENSLLGKLDGLVSRFEDSRYPYYRPGGDRRHETVRKTEQRVP